MVINPGQLSVLQNKKSREEFEIFCLPKTNNLEERKRLGRNLMGNIFGIEV